MSTSQAYVIRTKMRSSSEADDLREDDLCQRMTKCRIAQKEWHQQPIKHRLKIIKNIRHLLADRCMQLAETMPQSPHQSAAECVVSEILPLAESCLFLEKKATKILRTVKVGISGRPLWLFGVHSEIVREPFGIVFIIAPSNYPLFLAASHALQALAAGNGVVLKPAPNGTECLSEFIRLCIDAGVPEQLLVLLGEDHSSVDSALAEGMDKMVFTGSVNTGKILLHKTAEQVVPTVMELSGCDACVVLPSADLDTVTKALLFSLRWNHSETCIAARRVFIHEKHYENLLSLLESGVSELQSKWASRKLHESTLRQMEQLLANGAKIISGNEEMSVPTLLHATPEALRHWDVDIFAPLVALTPVADVAEAIQLANASKYGLGASVFGQSDECHEVAKQLQAGFVTINDLIAPNADARLPFAGRKYSGFGVTRGAEGLLEMTVPKVISQRNGPCMHFDPPHPADMELFSNYLKAAHGKNFGSRLRYWWKTLRSAMRKTSSDHK